MSADNERRARNYLADQYEARGLYETSDGLRAGLEPDVHGIIAIRAIMAALDEPAGSVGGEVRCMVCSEYEAHTGACGSKDPRALCNTNPAPPVVDEAMVMVQKHDALILADFAREHGSTFEQLAARRIAALTQPSQPGEEG